MSFGLPSHSPAKVGDAIHPHIAGGNAVVGMITRNVRVHVIPVADRDSGSVHVRTRSGATASDRGTCGRDWSGPRAQARRPLQVPWDGVRQRARSACPFAMGVMMVRVPRRLAVAGIVALSGPVLTACGSTTHFVERSAQELTVASHTWRFLGFNAPELTSVPGATSCGRVVDQATLNSILSNARQSGASVVRTWFFQSYYDMSNASGRWRRITPRWAAFDRLLKAATSYGIKVIPVLVDEWPYCEVAPVSKGLDFYQRGYEQPGYGYPLSFKSYAMAIARRYASNPTIAFWQIGNELESNSPGGCDERNSANALRAFADDMTRSIKRADPHHLVSLGTIGTGQCGLVGRDYQYVHAGEVDVCEYHDYGDAIHSIPSVEPGELGQRIAQCRALNKPLLIGEAGIVADVGDIGQSTAKITGTSLRLRAGFFDAKMTAAFDDGLVGYVIWDKRQDASNSDYK